VPAGASKRDQPSATPGKRCRMEVCVMGEPMPSR
jgi:DNA gyrase inhibitor GyrI